MRSYLGNRLGIDGKRCNRGGDGGDDGRELHDMFGEFEE